MDEVQEAGRRRALWCGILGGAVAWTLHLVLMYGISEWTCVGPMSSHRMLGVTDSSWLLLLTSLLLVVLAFFAGSVGFRAEPPGRGKERVLDEDAVGEEPAEPFAAKAGLITS